jgi:plastocyanin
MSGALLTITLLLPMVVASRGTATSSPREIRMFVKDMTFYIEGQSEPNPTLRVHAGEQIRLVLRNQDAGMSHDFTVSSWQVTTPIATGRNAEAVVVFRAPQRRGTYTYNCMPHAEMMRGIIQVE